MHGACHMAMLRLVNKFERGSNAVQSKLRSYLELMYVKM